MSATRTPTQYRRAAMLGASRRTPLQRSLSARKGWETRRLAQKEPARSVLINALHDREKLANAMRAIASQVEAESGPRCSDELVAELATFLGTLMHREA